MAVSPADHTAYTIAYPRRRAIRALLRGLGRVIVPLLARPEISGRANFPAHGPLIVVGNHVATMEVVLMVVYTPRQLEMLGAGDIAPPGWMNTITQLYGLITINRGNFDRAAMTQALDVLRQGGVLGVFPEGGVWDPGAMEAKRGVAWLSYHTGAPILPIGFGGAAGALDAALKFRRPRLTMNVGTPLPPVTVPDGVPRRQALQSAATDILQAVNALIPASYRAEHPKIVTEHFTLNLSATDVEGHAVEVPASNALSTPGQHAAALCKVFYRPWILHIFAEDLKLPVDALAHLAEDPAPGELARALEPILAYVSDDNPGFFTYRFGTTWGLAMEASLHDLYALAQWAVEHHLSLSVQPTRRYRLAGQMEDIVETQPPAAQVW